MRAGPVRAAAESPTPRSGAGEGTPKNTSVVSAVLRARDEPFARAPWLGATRRSEGLSDSRGGRETNSPATFRRPPVLKTGTLFP
jgi:hypothetical protein